MPRDTLLKRTLFACDELSGFVHACGLVRPTGLEGLEPKSVRKKLKQPSFAAGVHRDEVYAGAELLGLELDEHIANVVAALQPIAGELGLPVVPASARLSVPPGSGASRTPGSPRLAAGAPVGAAARCSSSGTQMCAATSRSGRVARAPRRRTRWSRAPGASQNTYGRRRCGSGRGSRRARRRRRAPSAAPPRPRRRDRAGARPTRPTGRPSPPGTRRSGRRSRPARGRRSRSGRRRRGRRRAASRRQRGEQAVEVAVGRPPAARDPDQPGARDVAHVHACAVERLDELRRSRRARGRRRASSARRA